MHESIARVTSYLEESSAQSRLIRPRPARATAVARAERKIGLPFPESLKRFYLEGSDGLVLYWENGQDMGFLRIPSLANLIEDFHAWKELVLWMDDYDFPHVRNAKQAKRTYAAMKSWLPLVQLDGGDCFCVNCASRHGAMVFHQHDWYDGGTGKNGNAIAPNLESLVENWSKVCFTSPRNRNWPATFGKNGVRWTRRYFDPRYIMAE